MTVIEFHLEKTNKSSKNEPVPPYAILSHRWIQGQEVSYQEFLDGASRNASSGPLNLFSTKRKSGYNKIRAACQQALKDGLRYIWIDTCCIDKGDHDDVVRNIKSMYAYYQNAEVCYTYLADVDGFPSSSFENSKWFHRGWTLQELLAPSYVVFFDQAWNRIGSKDELKNEIATVTTIPKDVLSGERPIHDVDPLTRMTWAVGRETTKPQDQAYCLLGLLGVSIDPDYDEDVRMSFERLRTVFVETHPERGEVEAVEDFYSFLNDRYQSWMDSLKLVC
ncbi:HET-domain-containing protein [Dendrothele bispora CBS 962.96]|uniref:HET-domain-containing protein n=1 Tax=Dendrothele bispora (strain CBS 962.96) TaxID=1314807 RepID=A0A4S8M734_DENBC|nr:HET-domain-containing protein [Dendrothele bispora CBS 962.96]